MGRLVSILCPDCGDRTIASVEETENGLALRSVFREHRGSRSARRERPERHVTPVTVVPATGDDPSYWHGVSFTASPDDLLLALECPKHGTHLTLTLGEVRNAVPRARTTGEPTRVPAKRR